MRVPQTLAVGLGVATAASCVVIYNDLLLDGVVFPTVLRYALSLANPLSWLEAMRSCEMQCDFTLAPACVLKCLELQLVKDLVLAAKAYGLEVC